MTQTFFEMLGGSEVKESEKPKNKDKTADKATAKKQFVI